MAIQIVKFFKIKFNLVYLGFYYVYMYNCFALFVRIFQVGKIIPTHWLSTKEGKVYDSTVGYCRSRT